VRDQGERRLTDQVLGAFHDAFGVVMFGLPEQICANTLAVELQTRNLRFAREVRIEIIHRGVPVGTFRVDFVVEDKIVLEIKSAEATRQSDELQLLNNLRVSKYELGFLLVFGVKPRFRRLVYSNSMKHR